MNDAGKAGTTGVEQNDGAQTWTDYWCRSQDGLKLHARDYGPWDSDLTPIICIPGLTRCARDFHVLAGHLTSRSGRQRRVLALSLRGRGRSEYDPDWRNYTVQRELLDVLDVMASAGVEHAIIVGTSRGGLISMAMAALRPAVLRGVVLNDIGPRIETQGLMRIMGQIERMPSPQTWPEAAALMQRVFQETFTDLTESDWDEFAREVFRDDDGAPKPDFDPQLIKTLNPEEIASGGVPELWPQFEALGPFPVLAIRGENSDILSAATLTEMAERHPDCTPVTVPHRGHVPFLREPVAVAAIDAFLDRIDGKDETTAPAAADAEA